MEKVNFNIKLNGDIYEILQKDRETFKVKSFNSLVNLIFNNYMLSSIEDDVCEMVWGRLADKKFNLTALKEVDEILKEVIYPSVNINRSNNKQINIRLNDENLKVYNRMRNGNNYLDSVFFRKMFEVYARKPKYKREEVLHYELIGELKEVCEKRKKAILKIKNTSKTMEVYPYSVVSAKEENYNYLLSANPENGYVYSTRISSIKDCMVINERYTLDVETENELREKTEEKIVTWGELERVEIILNSAGYSQYQRIIHNRPNYVTKEEFEREGESYYRFCFHTTRSNIEFYFLQFGGNCEIVVPLDLRNKVLEFFREAVKSYN